MMKADYESRADTIQITLGDENRRLSGGSDVIETRPGIGYRLGSCTGGSA